ATTSKRAARNSLRARAYSRWSRAGSAPQRRAISRIGRASWKRRSRRATRRRGAPPARPPRPPRGARGPPPSAPGPAPSPPRRGPGPLHVARGRIDRRDEPARRQGAGVLRGRVGERERAAAALDATGDVPDDADQERAEGRDALGPGPGEHAAGAEALDEDVLEGVVDLDDPGRPAPAGGQQGADERLVAAGEEVPALILTRRRPPDQAPTGRLVAVAGPPRFPPFAACPCPP